MNSGSRISRVEPSSAKFPGTERSPINLRAAWLRWHCEPSTETKNSRKGRIDRSTGIIVDLMHLKPKFPSRHF
jgi:hypothetical protein